MKKGLLIALLVLLTPSLGMGAFVDNQDGTVTDTVTGLMWQQATDGKMNWEEAIRHCEGLTLAGYEDWRLPNLKELRSIVDYSICNPAINISYFPHTLSSNYWSSTTHASWTYGAWVVYFYLGYGHGLYGYSKSNAYYVRAVRSGQSRLLDHLIISSPVQGSAWEFGDVLPIRWDTAGLGGSVEISLSREGGKSGTFTVIVAATDNDGIYDWTVEGGKSFNCVLKITPATDSAKGTTQGLFSFPTTITPALDIRIRANDLDGPIDIESSTPVSIGISLNPGKAGHNADWWLAYAAPSGWHYYDVVGGSLKWQPGLSVTYQGPLFNLGSTVVFSSEGLSPGAYIFYFGVDMDMNGNLDSDLLHYDAVTVNVQSPSPCTNIAGTWNCTETVIVKECFDGDCKPSYTVTRKDSITFQQDGCDISYELYVPGYGSFTRTGTISGNDFHLSGIFGGGVNPSCTITQNTFTIDGTVNGNRIDAQGSGIAKGTCTGGHTASVTSTSTAVLTRSASGSSSSLETMDEEEIIDEPLSQLKNDYFTIFTTIGH